MNFPNMQILSPMFTEPVQLSALSAQYERKFNLGGFDSLTAAMIIWAKTRVPEGESFNVHHAKERMRNMARENVRAQLQRQRGVVEEPFLGLAPPMNGLSDPIYVRTVSVSLTYRLNLSDYNSVCPSYTDWADVRHVAHSPTEMHIAIKRMWASLWANIDDELARAQGQGATDAFFGLPHIAIEDLTGETSA